ncbi:MAG: DoxX family protein [Thioalkalivibrio sp.]
MNTNATRIVSWVLALIFLLSGGAKLVGLEFEIEAFTRWGYPLWFMYLAGALEVIGGIALLVPRVSALASAGLAAFMIGAVATHVVHTEWAMLVVALAIMLTAAWRAWAGTSDILAVRTAPLS